MRTNEKRTPSPHRRRDNRAVPSTRGARLGRLTEGFSRPGIRKARRQARHWLEANGLTIALVFAMMVAAWIVAER
jgi:hypothetical protein